MSLEHTPDSPRKSKKHKKRDARPEFDPSLNDSDAFLGLAAPAYESAPSEPASTKNHKHKKRKSLGADDAQAIEGVGQYDEGVALKKSKKQKRKEAEAAAASAQLQESVIDPELDEAPRKKRKKHHREQAVEEPVEHVPPPVDDEGDFIIEEDENYTEPAVQATPEPVRKKKKKKHREVAAAGFEGGFDEPMQPMDSLLGPTVGFNLNSNASRPSLSLLDNANAFFDSPVDNYGTPASVPSYQVPDIAVDPTLTPLTGSDMTDTARLLHSYTQAANAERRKKTQQAQQKKASTMTEEDNNAAVLRHIDSAEAEEARAKNKEDTAQMKLAFEKAGKKSKKTLTMEEQEKLAKIREIVAGDSPEEFLATKWLDNSQLALLASQMGFVYKTGRFSAAEDTLIREFVQRHKKNHKVSDEEWVSTVGTSRASGLKNDRSVYVDLAREIGMRSVLAVFNRVRRMYVDTAGRKGAWSAEEDALLKQSHMQHGPNWNKAAELVGRSARDCRDRYRNVVIGDGKRTAGAAWSAEEEKKMDQVIRKMARDTDVDILRTPHPDIAWSAVSTALGGVRTRLSCSNRWQDITYRMLIGRGKLSHWTEFDTYQLIKRVYDKNLASEDAIDWSELHDKEWCLWSGNTIRKHYQRLKKLNDKAAAAANHRDACKILYDATCRDVNPDDLKKPDHVSWKGLKELPTPGIECYGQSTRSVAGGTRTRKQRVVSKKASAPADKAAASKKKKAGEADVDVEAAAAAAEGAGNALSNEYIDDSDAEAE